MRHTTTLAPSVAAIGILAAIVVPCESRAQDAMPAAEVRLSQPYASKAVGNLMLPFGWEVVRDDQSLKRLEVIEADVPAPAVITIDLVDLPAGPGAKEVAEKISLSLSEELSAPSPKVVREKPSCGKKCPNISIYVSDVLGSFEGSGRRCAMRMMFNNRNALVLSMCAAGGVSYIPDLPSVLSGVIAGMEGKR